MYSIHQNWTLIYSSHTSSRSPCDWFTACAHAGGCGSFCRYGVIYGCRGRWRWRRPGRQLKSASYTWRKACLKWTFKQTFSKHQGGKNGNSSKVQRAFVLSFALTPAIFINEFQQVFPLMVLVRAWLSCNVSLHCLFVGFHWCASVSPLTFHFYSSQAVAHSSAFVSSGNQSGREINQCEISKTKTCTLSV